MRPGCLYKTRACLLSLVALPVISDGPGHLKGPRMYSNRSRLMVYARATFRDVACGSANTKLGPFTSRM